MKRELYNLGNEEFALFVNKTEEILKDLRIPHTFVGGTAVQAHTLKRLCEKYDTDVSTLASNKHIRFQNYVRSTDDVDLALLFPDNASDLDLVRMVTDELYGSLEGVYLSGDEEHLFEYGLVRRGISRPVFSVAVDEVVGENLALNLSKQSRHLKGLGLRFYDEFIAEGEDLVIPYSDGFDIRMRAYKPEHVLATKISQFRAKDAMDLKNLVTVMHESGEEVDEEELRKILLPLYTDNLGKFNSLTGMNVDLNCNNH